NPLSNSCAAFPRSRSYKRVWVEGWQLLEHELGKAGATQFLARRIVEHETAQAGIKADDKVGFTVTQNQRQLPTNRATREQRGHDGALIRTATDVSPTKKPSARRSAS